MNQPLCDTNNTDPPADNNSVSFKFTEKTTGKTGNDDTKDGINGIIKISK